MSNYLNIYDHTRKKVAILENAYNIVEDEQLNAVGTLSFDLPIKDPKTALCQPFFYARYGDTGQLYRILAPVRKRSDVGSYSYTCEHVIATLIDDVIFGSTVVGNLGTYTKDVIQYVLSRQSVTRWVLGECDFSRQFEYGWENENLLSCLFSIPNLFIEPYMWKFDTSVFPWRLSLKFIDIAKKPQFYVRAAKNMLVSDTELDYAGICTRLYMLGYGEGVNQLKVSEVNDGKPYIQSNAATVNKYGGTPISRILVDRRFEDPKSLLEYGKAQLAALENPVLQNTVKAADLYELTKADYDKAELGRIIMLTEDDTTTYIVGIRRNYNNVGEMDLTLANTPFSIASTIADLADRQRIESVYAQGATQIYAQSVQANATSEKGAVIQFYIPADMRIINWVKAKIRLNKFRTYANTTKDGHLDIKTTGAGGGTVESEPLYTKSENTKLIQNDSTEDGGGTVATNPLYSKKENVKLIQSDSTEDGGGTVATNPLYSKKENVKLIQNDSTESGGDTVGTSVNKGGASTSTSDVMGGEFKTGTSDGGSINTSLSAQGESLASAAALTTTFNFGYDGGQNVTTTAADGKGSHSHSFMMPGHSHSNVSLSHSHSVNIPSHSHSVQVGAHSHTIDISKHTHSVTTPEHSHTVNLPAHKHKITLAEHKHEIVLKDHKHKITLSEHKHQIELDPHKHKITLKEHQHQIVLKDHVHEVNIPDHKHDLLHGIFEHGNPQRADIYVNGVCKATMERDVEIDISQYLLGADRKIPRGSWLSVEVRPNDLAYITIDLIIKGFCQSRGDNTY